MKKTDRNLGQLYQEFDTIITLPCRDNFLCGLPPVKGTHHYYFFDPGYSIHIGRKHTTHSKYSILHNYTTGAKTIIDTDFLGDHIPFQCGIRYEYNSPYHHELCQIGRTLLQRDQRTTPLTTATPKQLYTFLSNYKLFHPLIHSFGFDRYAVNHITNETNHDHHSTFPLKQFFKTYSLALPKQRTKHQREEEYTGQKLGKHLIETIIHNTSQKTSQKARNKLQLRHALNSTSSQWLGVYPIEKTTSTTLSNEVTILSCFTHYTTKRLPMITQSINENIFSQRTPRIVATKFTNKIPLPYPCEDKPAITQEGIIIDGQEGKIYIHGDSFTSDILPSQKFLIETLTILLKEESIPNTSLPPSSYAKNKNTFASKIAIPFNKLLASYGYKNTYIKATGPLYQFTVSLLQQDVSIILIQKVFSQYIDI